MPLCWRLVCPSLFLVNDPCRISSSSHVPMSKFFKFLRLIWKSNTLHTQWTAMILILNLEAFESNLHAIIWAKRTGRNAALVSIFTQTHQTFNRSENQAATALSENPKVAHHLIASLIQTIHLIILKYPHDGSSKGIFILLACTRQLGKLMKTQFRQLWKSSFYQTFQSLFTTWKCFTIQLHNQIGNCWKCLFEAMYLPN